MFKRSLDMTNKPNNKLPSLVIDLVFAIVHSLIYAWYESTLSRLLGGSLLLWRTFGFGSKFFLQWFHFDSTYKLNQKSSYGSRS
jgi:hypothetical protein